MPKILKFLCFTDVFKKLITLFTLSKTHEGSRNDLVFVRHVNKIDLKLKLR